MSNNGLGTNSKKRKQREVEESANQNSNSAKKFKGNDGSELKPRNETNGNHGYLKTIQEQEEEDQQMLYLESNENDFEHKGKNHGLGFVSDSSDDEPPNYGIDCKKNSNLLDEDKQ